MQFCMHIANTLIIYHHEMHLSLDKFHQQSEIEKATNFGTSINHMDS